MVSTHDTGPDDTGPDGECPVTGLGAEFNPFEPPYLDDPYEFFARARREEPVFYSDELGYWVIASYDDVRAVLRDADAYSAANVQEPITPWPADAADEFASHGFTLRPNLSNNDPPSHTLVRGFLRNAFNPSRVAWLEPHVGRLAVGAVDRFEPVLRSAPGAEVDLVAEMLWNVPAEVLFVFLGIPDADIDRVKRWSAGRTLLTWGRRTPDEIRQEIPDFVEYVRYCFDLVDELERNPGDDYTSELLRRIVDEQPEDFDKDRVAQTLFGLLMAGHETTTNQSALAVRALLSTPGAWQRLVDRPDLIPGAVEELLRHDSSVVAWRRITRRPVVLSGVAIPTNAPLLLLLGSANHDERHFVEPHRVDLERANARNHLSFGFGNHYCLGAPLARLELRILLEVLTERLPDLELVPTDYEFSPNTSHRGPTSLPVRLATATIATGAGRTSHE